MAETVNARCRACDHLFAVCELPMQVADFANTVLAARCPRCDGKDLAIDQSSKSQPEEKP